MDTLIMIYSFSVLKSYTRGWSFWEKYLFMITDMNPYWPLQLFATFLVLVFVAAYIHARITQPRNIDKLLLPHGDKILCYTKTRKDAIFGVALCIPIVYPVLSATIPLFVHEYLAYSNPKPTQFVINILTLPYIVYILYTRCFTILYITKTAIIRRRPFGAIRYVNFENIKKSKIIYQTKMTPFHPKTASIRIIAENGTRVSLGYITNIDEIISNTNAHIQWIEKGRFNKTGAYFFPTSAIIRYFFESISDFYDKPGGKKQTEKSNQSDK